MVRRAVVLAGTLLMLGGCGGSSGPPASRTPAPSTTPAAKRQPRTGSDAPVLVQLTQQRPGALIDKITVHTDGYGLFDRPSGGVGRVLRDVIVDPAVLRRLRAGLEALGTGRTGEGDGSPAANGATYIMRYHGRTFVARQGAEPKALREPLRLLAGTLVGDGIRTFTRERLGGVAGGTHLSGIGKVKQAPSLVFFQRQGAGGATLDTFTVRRDGTATLAKRYGGAGGRFKELVLETGTLPRLRRALAALPRGSTLSRGRPAPGGAQYLLRYRGRTQTGRQGAIAPSARAAVKLLDGFIDGIGVRRTTSESSTNSP
jgi:hypothetical protein